MGTDPLAAAVARTRPSQPRRGPRWLRSRLALGLSPTPLPGVLLPIGIALGPAGLGLLSPRVLSYLDPVVAVALAALGVLVGLGLDLRRPQEGRLLGAAVLEGGLTSIAVTAALVLLASGRLAAGMPAWLPALIVGVCAAASSTAPSADSAGSRALAARVGDLDDLLPIVLGALALAFVRSASGPAAVWLTVQVACLAAAVAASGWLLVTQAASDSEQRVFSIAAILLLGGIAEFLSLSALLTGLVAGILWGVLRGEAREQIASDARHMQHPLVVLLLLIAGARAGFSPVLGLLVILYATLRLAGKVVGGWLAGRVTRHAVPASVGLHLISPGVVAVALALNVRLAAGDRADTLVSIVVAGSIVSEIMSLLLRPREVSA